MTERDARVQIRAMRGALRVVGPQWEFYRTEKPMGLCEVCSVLVGTWDGRQWHEVNADPVRCESAELAVEYARSAILELSGADKPLTSARALSETRGNGQGGPRHRSIARQKGHRVYRSVNGRVT